MTEIGLQLHIMRLYVFWYTFQEAFTFNVWQLYEQMAGSSILFVVEGAFKNVSNYKAILAFNFQS